MSLVLKNGRVLTGGEFAQKDVLIENGKITQIGENLQGEKTIDLQGKNLLPGFIDTHTHGGGGWDVNLSTAEELCKISDFFAAHGTTAWLASILTDTKEKTLWCIDNVKQAMKYTGGAKLYGIHLEGPFLSLEYKGAMPPELLKTKDINLFYEYQNAAEGAVKYMTVSPEAEGMIDMIKEIAPAINVGIGHSGADYCTAQKAIDSGATVSTHTFNAMRPLHHHEGGVVAAALVSDIWCEAILDGKHLAPHTVKLILKTKGYDRVVGVTDSIMAAGLPDGEYKLGVNDVVVKDGDARLKYGNARAGSTLTMDKALKNLVEFTGKPVEKVAKIISENPAKALGIFDQRGSIDIGKYADIVVTDQDLNLLMTFSEGNLVYQK